jgi:hypothetical protein
MEHLARLLVSPQRALRAFCLFEVANETDRAVAGLGELAAGYRKSTVVIVNEHSIAADRVEGLDRAV